MHYLRIFGLEFEKSISVFEISILVFPNCKVSRKKQKCLNLGPKTPYLGICRLEFKNVIVIIEIITLEFV